MVMPGRNYTSASGYRYGFNGMEKDDEVKGNNNSLDFGARIYDPRVGRWLSVDPKAGVYPDISSYSFAINNPVIFIDPEGKVIVDPKSGRKVVKIDGEWKTIKRVGKDGNVKYGKVSAEFKEVSQPVLDVMTSYDIGTEIYNEMQNVSTKIEINTKDKYNRDLLDESGGNAKTSPYTSSWKTDNDGFYKSKMIVTPDLETIKEGAEADGVDFDEKLLQVMSVEKDHITDPDQIAKERSYNGDFTDNQVFEDVYTKPLNEAVRVGIEYRKETGQKVDESSNFPITKTNERQGTNIKVKDEGN